MLSQQLTHQGLHYVLEHLWSVSSLELDRLGLSKADAWKRFTYYMTTGPAKMIIADGVPVVAVGTAKEGDEWFTWFIATDKFVQHGKAATKEIRKLVKEHVGDLFVYSQCVHPDLPKWLRIFGFKPDGWEGKTPEGFPLYRFKKD